MSDFTLRVQGTERRVRVSTSGGRTTFAFDDGTSSTWEVERTEDGRIVLRGDGRTIEGAATADTRLVTVSLGGPTHAFERVEGGRRSSGRTAELGAVVAPMTGRVIEIVVQAGDVVEAGATLAIVEAMKMEHRLTAPARARVGGVRAKAGDGVSAGDVLLELVAPDPVEPPR